VIGDGEWVIGDWFKGGQRMSGFKDLDEKFTVIGKMLGSLIKARS